MAEPRQANVGKVGSCRRKLSRAIGRYVDARERRVVECEWERQWNIGHHIIPVIPAVGRAWHDAAPYLTDRVDPAGRCWRRCRCWRKRSRSCRCRCRCGRRASARGPDEVCARRHTSWRVGACCVTPYLCEVDRILLHSYRESAIRPSCVAGHQVVVHIEPTREGGSFVEDHLVVEVGSRIARVVGIAPLDDKRPVRSSAVGRVEDATGGAGARDRILVHPHGAYGVGGNGVGQTGNAEAGVIGAEA